MPDSNACPQTVSRRDAAVKTEQGVGRFDGVTLDFREKGNALHNWPTGILFSEIQIVLEVPRFGLEQ